MSKSAIFKTLDLLIWNRSDFEWPFIFLRHLFVQSDCIRCIEIMRLFFFFNFTLLIMKVFVESVS